MKHSFRHVGLLNYKIRNENMLSEISFILLFQCGSRLIACQSQSTCTTTFIVVVFYLQSMFESVPTLLLNRFTCKNGSPSSHICKHGIKELNPENRTQENPHQQAPTHDLGYMCNPCRLRALSGRFSNKQIFNAQFNLCQSFHWSPPSYSSLS